MMLLSIKDCLDYFNTTLGQLQQVPFAVLRKKTFIMNQAWNHFKIDDGIENYPFYTKLLLTNFFLNVILRNCTTPQLEGQITFLCQVLNTIFFQNSYFPLAIKEWNKLDIDIRKSDSISIFKKRILPFIKPLAS